jgi:hypothetical protein
MIPSYVKKHPKEVVNKWLEIYKLVLLTDGESVALVVANSWLKQQRVVVESVVAKSGGHEELTKVFFVATGEELIQKTTDGEDYIDFVLTDNGFDQEDLKYSDELLKGWAEQINNGLSIVGDIDHKEFDLVAKSIKDTVKAAEIIKNMKKGIAKVVKAFYDGGKLFVRAFIDKRYRKHVNNAKGVSLEALVKTRPVDGGKEAYSGELLGFTFAVKDNPVNPRATFV